MAPSFLQRNKGPVIPDPPPIQYDRFLGIPRLRALSAELNAGRWEPVHEALSQLTNPDDRAFATRIITDQGAFPLEDWRRAKRDSALCWYAVGEYQINSAWLVRGAGPAALVPPPRWQRFLGLLHEAEASLQRAVALDPTDPLPWAALIKSGMGLGVGPTVLAERFLAAETASPGSVHAHLDMVTALSQRWGGSHDEMFAFARWATGNLPDGAAGHVALVAAHAERWYAHRTYEPDGAARAAAYYYDPTVRTELDDAMRRSLHSPAYRETMHSIVERNYAVLGFALGGHVDEAMALFGAIGDNFRLEPGSWLPGGPALVRARLLVGLPAE